MESWTRQLSPTRTAFSERRESTEKGFLAIREKLVDRIGRLKHRVEEIERELARLSEREGRLPTRTAAIIDELIGGALREISVSESALRRMAIKKRISRPPSTPTPPSTRTS